MTKITRPEDLFWPTPGHPVETIDNLDRIPIAENGDPLILLGPACPAVVLRPEGTSQLYVRAEVARRLGLAQENLDELRLGFKVVVTDAWRSPARQIFMSCASRIVARIRYPMLSAALIREAANKYVAAPDAIAPPPHSTGGAVDLRLMDDRGRIVPMGSWPAGSSRTNFESISEEAKANRALLGAALDAAGFSNYEEEWWHWSYGDSGWALRSSQPAAIYGKTAPGSSQLRNPE